MPQRPHGNEHGPVGRGKLRIAAFIAGLLLAGPTTAWAQASGRIIGRVLDQTGAVLPGVRIDLFVNDHELGTTTTDQDGRYRLDNVTAGSAELIGRLLNFSVIRRTVAVTAGQSMTADIAMTLSLNADVVVTGARTFRNIADVENPAENLVGIAGSASQGAITAAQLDARPMMRSGEVLETVPA